ncbi:TPA: hypothetical protein ACN976_001401 [Vibrio campbellii]
MRWIYLERMSADESAIDALVATDKAVSKVKSLGGDWTLEQSSLGESQ